MTHRILIVDDDHQIVRLLQSYLEKAGFQTLTTYEGDGALYLIRRERPDLILLDLMLPGQDGWEITRQLRADEYLSAIPIIMLTARVSDSDKIVGLELGADDYIAKPFNPSEVVSRVRAVLRRAAGAPPVAHILQTRQLRLDIDRHTVSINGTALETTPTQFALLRTLLENPGHAFTRNELIEKALGYSYEGLERTVDSHIKNLRKKIETDPAQPEYIETVFGVGYCLRADDEAV